MTALDRGSGLEPLGEDACRALLAGEEVGRLAMVVGGRPAVFPVNFALDGDAIVFRTAPGTKLDNVGRAPVAFEVDGLDRAARTGWSVVVDGRLEEVTRFDAATLDRLRSLALYPWADGRRDHWLRLVPSRLTGRRVRPHAAPPASG